MPHYENKKYTVADFEFPPVDYPNALGLAYSEFKDTAEGYGDMKSFICFDAGFRAALKYMEEKFVSAVHNTGSPKLPLLEESLNDLSAEFGGEFDSIKFQRGASAMYGYIVRQHRAGGV